MDITAAVLRDAEGRHELESVTLTEPGPGEVLVKVVGVGMCHTDVVPRGMPGLLPIIAGHEGAGIVEAVGDGVSDVTVGDHVVLTFDSCGTCISCQGGEPAYCETFMVRNLTGRDPAWGTRVTDTEGNEIASRWFAQSSFATHCLANVRNTVVVDPELPLELLGPLGCGILTGAGSIFVELDVQEGEGIIVFGAGAVGLAAIMAARVVDADPIIAVDLHESRLELAGELGATHTVDGADPELTARLGEICVGGADHTFDTTGVPSVMQTALATTRIGGRCGFVGVQTGDLVLDPLALVGKRVTGILEGGADPQIVIPELIALWKDGRFPFHRLVRTFPLAEINEAEEASASGEVIKPVLIP